jgi:hypothetical protein
MISSNPPGKLVKHIIRAYARLAENSRVRAVLKDNLPSIIKEKSFYQTLDESSKRWLQNLMKLLSTPTSNNTGFGNTVPMGTQMNPVINSNSYFNPMGIPQDGYTYENSYQVDNKIYQGNKAFLNMNNGFMYKNGK